MFKNLIKSLGLFFIILLSSTLVITLFNYFNLMNSKVISIMNFIIPMIGMLISSYRLGKLSDKNGYLEGLKLGSIIILIFVVLVILLDKLEFKSMFFYLILLLASVFGSMLGINRKKTNN